MDILTVCIWQNIYFCGRKEEIKRKKFRKEEIISQSMRMEKGRR
jgi:hypothetical protein